MDEPDAIWCVEGCGAMLSGCLIDKPANFVERVGEDPGGSSQGSSLQPTIGQTHEAACHQTVFPAGFWC